MWITPDANAKETYINHYETGKNLCSFSHSNLLVRLSAVANEHESGGKREREHRNKQSMGHSRQPIFK
jgi:hypothetical protein